jgi:hypothetical protein
MSIFRKQRAGFRVRRRLGIVAAAVLIVGLTGAGGLAGAGAAVAAPTASAASSTVTSTVASPAGKVSSDLDTAEPGVCPGCTPPMIYKGGAVMGTAAQTGEVTITPIYWAPAGYGYPEQNGAQGLTYQAAINQYITDIAADSGKNTNIYGVNTQYSQTVNSVTTNIKYLIHAGTPLTDTDVYPAAAQQCTPTSTVYTACITQAQYRAELEAFTKAQGLPADLGHFYALFFPLNVQEMIPGSPPQYSNSYYCGSHGAFTTKAGGTLVYGDEPFDTTSCFFSSDTTGNADADAAINTLSHEIDESITDPLSSPNRAWNDSSGWETSDECAGNYGPALGTFNSGVGYPAGPYNQVINGHDYYTQTNFDNGAYAALGKGNGCTQKLYVAPAPMTASAAHSVARYAHASAADLGSDSGSVLVDASPSNLPADGTSTSTVTVTVLDSNGDPVAGDPIAFSARSDVAMPGTCGTIGGGRLALGETYPVTNADGQATTTYTASSVDAECYVEATDLTQGDTNEAIVYQGADTGDAPSVTQTLPASLAAGGAMSTFTATATNPSSTDISDAQFDLYITGDNNGSAGVDASQLTLSYKDPATNGDFVDVPLTGSTANGGEIDGFVIPDTAQNLGAGASKTATFELTLAAGAPDSATTGAPLKIETDLDSIDPADDSQANLDRTAPTAVSVVQAPGDTVTFSGKFSTSVVPTATKNGSGTLVASTCKFMSDGATCRLTGTAVLTTTGGTLTGFISTDDGTGTSDRTVSFTENFTNSGPNAASGTGTAEVTYFDNGNTSEQNLTASDTTAATKTKNVVTETGTITLTNPAP